MTMINRKYMKQHLKFYALLITLKLARTHIQILTKTLVLCPAIEWLLATLHLGNKDGVIENSNKLKHLMLNDTEWVLLQELINIFKPFDKLTTCLSRIYYTTLSVVNPTI